MLKGKLPLIIAALLAIAAAIFAHKTLSTKEKEITEGWQLVPIVVANRNIIEGHALDFDMIAKRPMPEQFVTPSMIKPNQFEKVVGQRVMAPLQTGDPIMWSHFRAESTFERLSNMVRKRGRAISIPISGSAGVSGWIRPNDHVDIIGTFQEEKQASTDQRMTITLMQDVMILAVGKVTAATNIHAYKNEELNYSTITVHVLPEEAEILVLAAQVGDLYLSLRNPDDIGGEEERRRTTIETLLTGERIKALKTQRKRSIDIVRLSGK